MKNKAATATQLNHLLLALPQQAYHLVLIAGEHGTGKTYLLKEFSRQQNIPYLSRNNY